MFGMSWQIVSSSWAIIQLEIGEVSIKIASRQPSSRRPPVRNEECVLKMYSSIGTILFIPITPGEGCKLTANSLYGYVSLASLLVNE